MSNHNLARMGAILFVLWGLIHVAGGGSILLALAGGANAGFAIYQNAQGEYPPLAGAILGYLAFGFLVIGMAVAAIGTTANWRNTATGLALNTALAGLTDLGLLIFLMVPGYVSIGEGAIGIGLFVTAAIIGGIACTRANAAQPA